MKLYTFDTRNLFIWDLHKNNMLLSYKDIHHEIEVQFKKLVSELQSKKIEYNDFRNMLTPQKDKNEICLIFDRNKIDNAWYGNVVFNEYFPRISTLDKICVFEGDLLSNSQKQDQAIVDILKKEINVYHSTDYQHSNQYYIVYINKSTTPTRGGGLRMPHRGLLYFLFE